MIKCKHAFYLWLRQWYTVSGIRIETIVLDKHTWKEDSKFIIKIKYFCTLKTIPHPACVGSHLIRAHSALQIHEFNTDSQSTYITLSVYMSFTTRL